MTSENTALPLIAEPPRPGSNVPEYSVSSLARAVKGAIEDRFGMVRVRGEISQAKLHSSGHLYLRLKDETAVIEAVCWRGTMSRLAMRPEDGMEVICTGKLTTYPGRSQYQLVIETMELAGEGALLKLLEERKRRLAAEGLFESSRKKAIPFLPRVIGVITSPTGAVIRDILHRLNDRFPRHVLLWPVAVQGESAAAQVAAAIEGFNRIPPDGAIPRPDLLIVARGGGSLEDLMPFNEEVVVRAAAASRIPLISAVGHETDTTLIDFAADLRAPTPTAAAEMAVPVRAELLAQVLDCGRRIVASTHRFFEERRVRVEGLGRGLGDPKSLILSKWQTLDDRGERLALAVAGLLERRAVQVNRLATQLRHPREVLAAAEGAWRLRGQGLDGAVRLLVQQRSAALDRSAARLSLNPVLSSVDHSRSRLIDLTPRLDAAMSRLLDERQTHIGSLEKLLESYSFKNVLSRGYALITDNSGQPVIAAADLHNGQAVTLHLQDGETPATIGHSTRSQPAKPKPPAQPKQESLF